MVPGKDGVELLLCLLTQPLRGQGGEGGGAGSWIHPLALLPWAVPYRVPTPSQAPSSCLWTCLHPPACSFHLSWGHTHPMGLQTWIPGLFSLIIPFSRPCGIVLDWWSFRSLRWVAPPCCPEPTPSAFRARPSPTPAALRTLMCLWRRTGKH